jgi:hypothetical protein
MPEQSSTAGELPAGVEVLPAASIASVAPVSRFVLRRSGAASAEDLLLVRGELSDYYARKILRREVPESLEERRVPVTAWPEGDAWVLAPAEPLAPDSDYALAVLGVGPIETLHTAIGPLPSPRLWPPAGLAGGSDHIVQCGLTPPDPPYDRVLFEPGERAARVAPGADGFGTLAESCVSLIPEHSDDDRPLVPPLELFGGPLDPAPITTAAGPAATPPDCAADEIAAGFGCARVLDDRVLIRAPDVPTLWVTRAPTAKASVVRPGDTFVIRPFVPDEVSALALVVRDPSGRWLNQSFAIHTASLAAHLVLSEVMANPLGAEPAQEWIEVVNDGLGPVDLAGYRLADSAGQVELPSRWVAPGERVLLVRDDYSAEAGYDVAPAPGTAIVRLPSLGKNGLSNAGEALSLLAADGSVASRFPALPKPKPGISIARRAPDTPDEALDGFGLHAEPGASPGGPNQLADD